MNHETNLKNICQQIGAAISLEIDKSNPDEILGKLNSLTSLLGTSSHAVALAESLYAEKLMQLTEDNMWSKLTATDKRMVFAGRAKTEAYYVTLTERQNRALTHGIDALRSMISYLKAEWSNIHNQ